MSRSQRSAALQACNTSCLLSLLINRPVCLPVFNIAFCSRYQQVSDTDEKMIKRIVVEEPDHFVVSLVMMNIILQFMRLYVYLRLSILDKSLLLHPQVHHLDSLKTTTYTEMMLVLLFNQWNLYQLQIWNPLHDIFKL